jgi:3-hydroxyisobutyrate dehydrogenase-like beta-hydroxyacid dehydrogenase
MKIGFIGVGNMGGPMCRNIIKKSGFEVMVFDLDKAAIARCTELGATAGDSPKDLAAACDVVMTSLPHPRNVEQVVLGENGIAEGIKPGAVYCDLSTNSPLVIRKLAALLEKQGVTMLDAPVSGGVVLADKGKIAIMVGGDKATFGRLVPLFESYGENVIYCGDIGNGCVAKIANNLIAFCNMAASAEGLMLGVSAGIDLEVLNQVIRNSSGNSMTFRAVAKNAKSGDWTASFSIDLAYKDMHLALELADELGVPLMLSPTVHNLMRMAKGLGYEHNDATAIMRVYEDTMNKILKLDN